MTSYANRKQYLQDVLVQIHRLSARRTVFNDDDVLLAHIRAIKQLAEEALSTDGRKPS